MWDLHFPAGKPNKSRRRKGSDDSDEDDYSGGDDDSDEDDDDIDYHEDESDGDNIPEAGNQIVGRATAAAINDSINGLKEKGLYPEAHEHLICHDWFIL